MQQLFKVQLNKQDGQGWRDMSYSPRTEQEAQAILNHYQSAFPKFIYRLREFWVMYDYERTSYTAVVVIVMSILLLGAYVSVNNQAPVFPESKEYLAWLHIY